MVEAGFLFGHFMMKPYKRRNVRLQDFGFGSYQEYLKSDLWKAIRLAVLERDGNKCVACKRPATCVHHTKYSKAVLFDPKPKVSTVSLCGSCHRFIEFDKNGNKLRPDRVMDKLRWLCRKNGTVLPGRCVVCMKGGGSKSDNMCKRCRKTQASGVTATKIGNQSERIQESETSEV